MLDISEVEQNVFLGAHPGEELPSYITAILNLCPQNLVTNYHDNVNSYLWLPLHDSKSPTVELLNDCVDYILHCKNLKLPVLVHCQFGITRSATVMCAFLIKEHGWELNKAYQELKKRRSCISIDPKYFSILLQYEDSVIHDYNLIGGSI